MCNESAYQAAAHFVDTWAELAQGLPSDYGCTLTCSEAESLAELFRAFEKPETADALMTSHSEHDEYGDDHYQGEEES